MSVICPWCGERNELEKRTCVNCGEDIPEGVERIYGETYEGSVNPVLILKNINDKKELVIDKDAIIGGRNHGTIEQEYFDKDDFISDPQCELFFDGEEWYIRDTRPVNHTCLNHIELPDDVPRILRSNDILEMADMIFRVSFRRMISREESMTNTVTLGEQNTCTTEMNINSGNKDVDEWVVKCPVCGSEYVVENCDERIKECSCCIDKFDKKKIAKAVPRRTRRRD